MAHVSFTIQIQYTGSYFPNSSIRCNLLITLLVQLELIWGSGFKTPKLRRRIWHWQNPCSELALSSVGSQISESERFAVIGLRQTCDTSVLMHNLQNSASVVGKAFFFVTVKYLSTFEVWMLCLIIPAEITLIQCTGLLWSAWSPAQPAQSQP